MSKNDEEEFSTALMKFINEWKKKPGNLVMVLHKVQEELGYISRGSAQKVADLLGISLSEVWGVVSFYTFFKTTKPGEHVIQVCLGTACYLKGGEKIVEELDKLYGLKIGGLTSDEKYSLDAVRCLGCCGLAPVMTVDGEVFGKVTKEKVAGIVGKFN